MSANIFYLFFLLQIPINEPKSGESRPSLWLKCWLEQVVIAEGVIEEEDGSGLISPNFGKDSVDSSVSALSELGYVLGKLNVSKIRYCSYEIRKKRAFRSPVVYVLIPKLGGIYHRETPSNFDNEGLFGVKKTYLLNYSALQVIPKVNFVLLENVDEKEYESVEELLEEINRNGRVLPKVKNDE